MRDHGPVGDAKDVVTKEYADSKISQVAYNDPASNLLADFSFDAWSATPAPTQWSLFWKTGAVNPTFAQATGVDAVDAMALRVNFLAATSSQRIAEVITHDVVPGQRLQVSVWAKGSGSNPQVGIDLLTNAAGGNPDYFASGVQDLVGVGMTVVNGTWTLYSGSVVVPSGQVIARLSITAAGDTGDVVWVDRATLRVAVAPTPFNGVPAGGAIYAVLMKASATDYDTSWALSAVGATPNTVMARDAAGRAKVASPSATDDIASKGYVDARLPAGAITMYGGAAAPAGWLLCNGASLLRTDYPDLFAAIGTTYGAADGTHFTLPNLANKFPRGNTPSTGAGADTHSHDAGTLVAASHTHSISAHTHTLSSAGWAQMYGAGGTSGGAVKSSVAGYSQAWRATATAGSPGTVASGTPLDGATDSTGVVPGNSAPDVSGTTGTTSNVPAYTGVAFIIKT